MRDARDTALLDLGTTLSYGFLLSLRKLRDDSVTVLLSLCQSLGLATRGFIRKILLIEIPFVGDADVEAVILLFGLVDTGDAVIVGFVRFLCLEIGFEVWEVIVSMNLALGKKKCMNG